MINSALKNILSDKETCFGFRWPEERVILFWSIRSRKWFPHHDPSNRWLGDRSPWCLFSYRSAHFKSLLSKQTWFCKHVLVREVLEGRAHASWSMATWSNPNETVSFCYLSLLAHSCRSLALSREREESWDRLDEVGADFWTQPGSGKGWRHQEVAFEGAFEIERWKSIYINHHPELKGTNKVWNTGEVVSVTLAALSFKPGRVKWGTRFDVWRTRPWYVVRRRRLSKSVSGVLLYYWIDVQLLAL